RGLPLDNLPQAVFLQIAHAVFYGFLTDSIEVGVFSDQFADAVVDDQNLKNSGAAIITGAAAVLADHRLWLLILILLAGRRRALFGCRWAIEILDLVRRQVGLAQQLWVGLVANPAIFAQTSDQPLAEHRTKGGRHGEGLDAQVEQAPQGGDGVVGMQRRKDHVPRLGSLAGDFRRFRIADF